MWVIAAGANGFARIIFCNFIFRRNIVLKNKAVFILPLFLIACGGEKQQQAAPASEPASAPKVAAESAPAVPTEVDKAALVEQAKAVVKEFGGTLKAELQAAVKEGGAINALDVCHTKAPEIAQEMSAKNGVSLSRVSLKNRNPEMGLPNGWQREILNSFEARKSAGEPADQLAFAEVVDMGSGKEFRFMKAIPAGEVCLACHGEKIQPEVQQKISELYPDDQATGFKEGDLRGAFVLTRALP
jgi:hypothetical protein